MKKKAAKKITNRKSKKSVAKRTRKPAVLAPVVAVPGQCLVNDEPASV